MSGTSFKLGKREVCEWVRSHFTPDDEILDVGAGCGTWRDLLHEYRNMDAVEIFPNTAVEIRHKYRKVFCADVVNHRFTWYDLIIFGDVLEHMTVEDAQAVLAYTKGRCRDVLIAVPFLYPQGECYGNPWERHIQDDLTPELFNERYPGFEAVFLATNYGYFHRRRESGEQRDQSV